MISGLRERTVKVAEAHPALRRTLLMLFFIRKDLFARRHRPPIDRDYGIRTQRTVPLYLNRTGSSSDDHIVPYAGCLPSVARWAFDALPFVDGVSFLDIGCGKGRALILASEYPFSKVTGVELNPAIAALGRANVRRVASRYPNRTPIEIITGDASRPCLPEGDLVVFMYNPFKEPLVQQLCDHLADSLDTGRSITIIYDNPMHGVVFDRHPAFQRRIAEMRTCSQDEAPFAFDADEAIVIWHAGRGGPAVRGGFDQQIVIDKPGWRVVLSPDPT